MRAYLSPLLLGTVALIVLAGASYLLPGLIRLAPRLGLFELLAVIALHAGLIFGGLALIDRAARDIDAIHGSNKQRSRRSVIR